MWRWHRHTRTRITANALIVCDLISGGVADVSPDGRGGKLGDFFFLVSVISNQICHDFKPQESTDGLSAILHVAAVVKTPSFSAAAKSLFAVSFILSVLVTHAEKKRIVDFQGSRRKNTMF